MADPTGGATAGTISRLGLVVDANGMVTGSAQGKAALDTLMSTADQAEHKILGFASTTRAGFDAIGASARSIGTDLLHFGAGFAGLFTSFKGIEKFVEETSAAQNAQAQLEAALRSTGGAAGRSADELSKLAVELQRTTTFSDEAIKSAETMLTTFTHIRGDTFDEATRAAADLAARLGGDVVSAAQLVGKALQEPDQGLAQLNRQFRLFSDVEQDAIKTMVLAGNQAEAQAAILQRLQERFGGAATAARDTLGGALKGLSHDFGDLFEAEKGGTTGIVGGINAIDAALVAIKPHMGELVTTAEVLGGVVAGRWLASGVESLAGMARTFTLARAEGAAYLENTVRISVAETERTAVLVRQATIERALAAERLQSVVADRAALVERAAAINALVAADARLVAANEAAAASQTAFAAATAEASLAARAAAGASTFFTAALAPLGGPVGVSIIAAILTIKHAFNEESKAAQQATEDAEAFKRSLSGISNQKLVEARSNLQGSIASLQQREAPIRAQIDALPQPGTPDYDVNKTPQQLQALTAQLQPLVAAEQALQAQLDATNGSMKEQGIDAAGLSQNVKDMIAAREQELAKLTGLNAAYGQSDYALKILGLQYDARIKKAEDAKDHTVQERAALDALTDSILAQQIEAARNESVQKDRDEVIGKINDEADAMRKNYDATLDYGKASEDAARLAHAQGISHEFVEHAIAAENDRIQAGRTLSGQALEDRLHAIDAAEKLANATSVYNAQLQDTLDLQKKVHAAPLPADPQAEAVQRAYDDAKRAREAFDEQIVKGFADDLSNGIANVFHEGLASAQSFGDGVIRMLEQIAARAATLKLGEKIFGGGIDLGEASHISPPGGGITAFDKNQLSTFGVAAGAVIGVANALNTLTGAARNSAQALEEASAQYIDFVTGTLGQIDALRAQIEGSSFDSTIVQVRQQFQHLRDTIEGQLAGTRLEGYREQQLAEVNRLEAERIAQLVAEAAALRETTRANLEVRDLRAKGQSSEADARAFALQQQQDFVDFIKQFNPLKNPELFALFAQVQQDEKDAFEKAQRDAEAAKAQANQRAIEDANLAAAKAYANGPNGSQGLRDQADTQALILQHQRELIDLQAQGASAELLAATRAKDAAEEASLAWQQMLNQVAANNSAIQRDVSLGFKTPEQAFAEEAQNYHLGGLTIEQIRALYTPYSGTPLTDAQETQNKYIEQLIQDWTRWFGSQADAMGVGSATGPSPAGQREAITYAAQALTEQTGNRLADYASAELIESRKHTALLTDIAGGRRYTGSVADLQTIRALPVATGFSGAPTISINNYFSQRGGESDDGYARRIAMKVETILAEWAKSQMLRDGDPLHVGV